MFVAFDALYVYGIIVLVVAALLFWVGAFRELLNGIRWARRKFSPPPPPPLPKPLVVMGGAGGQSSVELDDQGKRRLTRAEPRYLIENQGPTAVRDVDAGVETFDRTQSHTFPGFHIPALAPGGKQPVENVGSIPVAMLADVHESAPFSSHFYWATFEDVDGNRWKAIYDPRDMSHVYEVLTRASDSV